MTSRYVHRPKTPDQQTADRVVNLAAYRKSRVVKQALPLLISHYPAIDALVDAGATAEECRRMDVIVAQQLFTGFLKQHGKGDVVKGAMRMHEIVRAVIAMQEAETDPSFGEVVPFRSGAAS